MAFATPDSVILTTNSWQLQPCLISYTKIGRYDQDIAR